MKDFDKTVDELYQLCRRVQKETDMETYFSVSKCKSEGDAVNVCIKNARIRSGFTMYCIINGGYQEKEEAAKAREHLNRLLIEKPCPYCEEEKHVE